MKPWILTASLALAVSTLPLPSHAQDDFEFWRPDNSGNWDTIPWLPPGSDISEGQIPGSHERVSIFRYDIQTSEGADLLRYSETRVGADGTLSVDGNLILSGLGNPGADPSLTLRDGGILNATRLLFELSPLSSPSLNIGAKVGETARAAGLLNVDEISAHGGGSTLTGWINFNHTETAYTFAQKLSGDLGIAHYHGVTIINQDNTHTGATRVIGGELRVVGTQDDGSSRLGSGALEVNHGALLTFTPSGQGQTQPTWANNATVQGGVWDVQTHFTISSRQGEGNKVLISQGGTLKSTTLRVDASAGGPGELGVTNPLSKVEVAGELYVGSAGAGTLTISNGGLVQSTFAGVGAIQGGDGSAQINGSGSHLNIGNGLVLIGTGANGSLELTNGGILSAGTVKIGEGIWAGQTIGGNGEVIVNGSQSTLTATNALTIGNAATGVLIINESASIQAPNAEIVLGANGGSGTIVFGGVIDSTDGPTPALAAGQLNTTGIHGAGGSAEVIFNHTNPDFSFSTSLSGNVGITSYSGITTISGNNTHTGDTLISGGTIVVDEWGAYTSRLGTGELIIENGGQLNHQGPSSLLWSNNVDISGPSSRWTATGEMNFAGSSESASMFISDGAAYEAYSTTLGAGGPADGSIAVIVMGEGSRFQQTDTLTIGQEVVAAFSLFTGATALADRVIIGDTAKGFGIAHVAGIGSKLESTGQLIVGQEGLGFLQISNGGLIEARDISIGQRLTGTTEEAQESTARILGSGSELRVTGSGPMLVGEGGMGTLQVGDGGAVTGSGRIELGRNGGDGAVIFGGEVYRDGTREDAQAMGNLSMSAIHGADGTARVHFNISDTPTPTLFDTAISGNAEVHLYEGKLQLQSNNSYTGGTYITGGQLYLETPYSVGTGAIYVSGTGTLVDTSSSEIRNEIYLKGGTYIRELQGGSSLAMSVNSDPDAANATGASILQGHLTDGGPVTTSFSLASSATNDWMRQSAVFSLSNTEDSVFVLQLSVNELVPGAYLGWYDSETQLWVNAIEGNTNNNPNYTGHQFVGSYEAFALQAGLDIYQYIGAWGVDDNAVWAVLNHNSDFSVVAIPEPSTYALVATALGLAYLRHRRRRDKSLT